MAKKKAAKKAAQKAPKRKTAKKTAQKTTKKTEEIILKDEDMEDETPDLNDHDNDDDDEIDISIDDNDDDALDLDDNDDDLDDSDDDVDEDLPETLEGDDLKNEIEELESVDSGKKNLASMKKGGRGGTRRVKPKHIVTARKPSGGLKFAPGVMLSGKKTTPAAEKSKPEEPQEFRRMTTEELKETKEKLIELRDRILENVRKELADYRHRSSSSSADPVDQAADAYDDNVTFEIAANTDEELEQIKSALEKIEKGTYGLCEMCDVAISPTRLKILPFATRCVNCRQTYEKTKVKKEATSQWAFPDADGEGDESEPEV